MIGMITTFKVAPDKMLQAKEPVVKMEGYQRKTDPDTQRFLFEPISGELSGIVHVSLYSSLSAFEEVRKKREGDPEWQGILKEIAESEWFLGVTRRIFDVIE